MTVVLFVAGLLLLIAGAEVLVRGASRLAARFGVAPLVIGLTVVAFGTSAPELAVGIGASLSGNIGIAIGNVVGSNIFNILFILGLSALIVPLTVSQQLVRWDVPIMVGISVLVYLFALNETLGRIEGAILFLGLVTYIGFLFYKGKDLSGPVLVDAQAAQAAGAERPRGLLAHWAFDVPMILLGLGMLVLGSNWLLDGAVALSRYFGVSDLIIGLTVVAAGTSLPEVATSVIAALRGERDIAVGNVVGSNIFNCLGVLGLSAFVAPGGLGISQAALGFDIPVMIAVAIACLPIFFTGNMISRWEGGLFLGYYIAYTLFLIFTAVEHESLPLFSMIMLYFVLPLTVVTIGVITYREVRATRQIKNRG